MVEVLELTSAVQHARAKWHYRGGERPSFADAVGAGEESVWDFPRPPRIEPVISTLRVMHGDRVLASTERGVRVVETAGAPTYYFPPDDVQVALLVELPGRSLCEWKGLAATLTMKGERESTDSVSWYYLDTFPEFDSIRGWYAFYPGVLTCYIGNEQVQAQPGGYYGGWVGGNLKGPIKGEPGSEAW